MALFENRNRKEKTPRPEEIGPGDASRDDARANAAMIALKPTSGEPRLVCDVFGGASGG